MELTQVQVEYAWRRAPDFPYRSSTHPPKTKNSQTASWRVFIESSSFSALFDGIEEP